MTRADRWSALVRRVPGPLLHSRWSLPIYAFAVAFLFVMVMVTDPYSGAFADANTAPNHWAQVDVGQTLATGTSSSGSITRDKFGSQAAPKIQSAGAPTAAIPDPGSAQAIALGILTAEGMGNDQYSCLVDLWNRESHWSVTAANPSGAYGIPQALPGSKMATEGADWRNNPETQIRWGLGYIKKRYGTACSAWSFKRGHGYY